MPSATGQSTIRARFAVFPVVLALFVVGFASAAQAVLVSAGPTTTLSSYVAGDAGVTYSFGTYQTEAGETLQSIVFDVSAGTDVSAATLVEPAGTLTVAGQTLTITLSPALPPGTDVTITIAGVTNPATADVYPSNQASRMEFVYTNAKGQTKTARLPIGEYTITPAPYLTMTIPTPNIDFGAVDPEVSPAPGSVDIVIDANAPYTISRTLTGDATALNLNVTGDAIGSKPAGAATYTESVTIAPGWDAPAGTPLSASIVYTAVFP